MTVSLHLGDCLEFMRTMAAGSVSAVVTDPPYGIGESRAKVMSRGTLARPIDYGDFAWDSQRIDPCAILEMQRVSRHQIIFGGNFYADSLPPSASWIVWDKVNGDNDFADCELAWTSHKRAVRIFRYMWNGMIRQRPEQRFHPTQKPLSLMVWVLENYTSPGDTIFDPFAGSGTTLVAAIQTGRNAIGCEIDEHYFNVAQRRIAAALAQPPLIPHEAAPQPEQAALLE